MPASLLEILRSIPDHRRREGKRFDLATVLLGLDRRLVPRSKTRKVALIDRTGLGCHGRNFVVASG